MDDRLWIGVFCVAAAAACGGDGRTSASADTGAEPVEPEVAEAPARQAPPPPEPGPVKPVGFDNAAFCQQVFPVGEVSRVLGQTGMLVQSGNRPPMPGTAECSYARYSGKPVAMATAIFDCRPEHPRLSSTVARLVKIDKGRYYRDVDIAAGGAYARNAANNDHQELVFVTDEPGCTVYVSTTYVSDDRTEALARVASERLTADNAPAL